MNIRAHISKVHIVCVALVLVTFGLYVRVIGHEFLNYDDKQYVSHNDVIQRGLTWEGVRWAFSSSRAYNWHPVTWLSHMLDCDIYGNTPGGHHLTNVLLHIANTVWLFLLLRKITGAFWRSAFVAALFALHPLHVESVAWVAERKDVLSTFFLMAILWAYTTYTEKRLIQSESAKVYYVLALVFYTLGLMSKAMLVTVPFLLLLLDYWPLNRFPFSSSPNSAPAGSKIGKLVLEKLPFFILTIIFCIVTFWAQHREGAVGNLESYPISIRLENAALAYVRYLEKTFWPADLIVFYPYQKTSLVGPMVVATLVLVAISVIGVCLRRSHPYFAIGWCWYLGTLVPVIGLVQVGDQAMADRYTYIPLIGIFVLIAWLAERIAQRQPKIKILVITVLCVSLTGATAKTHYQLQVWKNSETLFRHALKTSESYIAHFALGNHLLYEGIDQNGLSDLIHLLQTRGVHEEGFAHIKKTIEMVPSFTAGYRNLGVLLYARTNLDEAIRYLQQGLALKPGDSEMQYCISRARNDLGVGYARKGDHQAAMAEFSEVLRLDPKNFPAHYNLGVSLENLGQLEKAALHLTEAASLDAQDANAQFHLGMVHLKLGHRKEAAEAFRKAASLPSASSGLLNNLAWIMATSPEAELRDGAKAVELAEKVCKSQQNPDPDHLDTLAVAYAEAGRFEDAKVTGEKALNTALDQNRMNQVPALQQHLDLYRHQKPVRENIP